MSDTVPAGKGKTGGANTIKTSFQRVENLAWSAEAVDQDKTITMTADLLGFGAGKPASATFDVIDAHDPKAPKITSVDAKLEDVAGGKRATGSWKPDPKADLPLSVAFKLKAGSFEVYGPHVPVHHGGVVSAVFRNPALKNAPAAKLGDAIKLVARVTGIPKDTEVKFEVFDRDANKTDPAGTVTGKTKSTTREGQFEEVIVDWKVPRDLDVDDKAEPLLEHPDPHAQVAFKLRDIQLILRCLFEKKKIDDDPGPADGALHDQMIIALHDFKKKNGIEPADGSIDSLAFHLVLGEAYESAMRKPYEGGPADYVPDYFFTVEIKKHKFESALLEILPAAYRVCIEVGDPGLLGEPILPIDATLDDHDKRKKLALLAIKQRTQALGFYYEPLAKEVKTTALVPYGDPLELTDRWKVACDWFENDLRAAGKSVVAKDDREKKKGDAQAIEDADHKLRKVLVELLRKKLVVPAACDCKTTDDCKHATIDADNGNPVISGGDGRIRFPGGICFHEDEDLSLGKVATEKQLAEKPSKRAAAEMHLYENNPILGRIPLVAKVQVKYKPDEDKWRAAPDNMPVVFELIRTHTDDKGDADVKVLADIGVADTSTHSHKGRNPRVYVKEKMLTKFDAKDPRRANARTAVGGDRGSKNPGDAFFMGSALDELGPRWPWRAASIKGNAVGVRVMTGPDGTACAAFEPNRLGGDVYKVRVWVDQPGVTAPKDDAASEKYDKGYGEAGKPASTGLLTVWRALRFERYLRKPSEGDPSIRDGLGKTLDPPIKLKEVAKELKKAFFDVELGRELKEASEEISEDEYKKAHEAAVNMVIGYSLKLGLPNYDLKALLPYPGKTAHQVHLCEVGEFVKKSKLRPHITKPEFYSNITAIISTYHDAFMYQFTKDALPGITIFQSLVGDNVDYGHTFVGHCWRSGPRDETYHTSGGVVTDIASAEKTKLKDVTKFAGATKQAGAELRFVSERGAAGATTTLPGSNRAVGPGGIDTLIEYIAWLMEMLAKHLGLDAEKDIHPVYQGGQLIFHATTGTMKVIDPDDSAIYIEMGSNANGWDMVDMLEHWTPRDDAEVAAAKKKRNLRPTSTSGIATPFRGAYLFYGHECYDTYKDPKPEKRRMTYSIESNTLHEIGHLLFMKHQWTNKRDKNYKWWKGSLLTDGTAQFPLDHDYDDTCVMSYHECDGDLCGRCLLHLRGWDINQVSPNRPSEETLKKYESYLS
jgi:hypothetical protein